MIALDFKVGGGKKTSRKLTRFTRELKPNLKRGVDRATLVLEREIKRNLSKGGTFRKRKGEPWVKNPGPNLRVGDGTLRSSWKRTPAKRVQGGVEGHVASDAPYSRIHEYGAPPIPKRSYVQPALDKKRDVMMDLIAKEVTRPLR